MKVSMNASAMELKVCPRTIARRLEYLARIGRDYFANLRDRGIERVQFDELQSSVVSKCLPVAIPMAVCARSRRVVGIGVVRMPAQPPLDKISLRRYGVRPDDRPAGVAKVLESIKPLLARRAVITTDKALHYPEPIARILPDVFHDRKKSRRARHGGQSELKRAGFDPLFCLNHTAAMSRDRVGRMVRKTWGNSKRLDRHEDHMIVWAHFHNEVYLPWKAAQGVKKAGSKRGK